MAEGNELKKSSDRQDTAGDSGATQTTRISLGSRPSSEFLGEERSRISIIQSYAVPLPGLDDNLVSSYSEEDDNDGEDILPQSLTDDWEEKTGLSQDRPSTAETVMKQRDSLAAEETRKIGNAPSIASQMSRHGHNPHDSIRSSITFTNGPRPPPISRRVSSLRQPGAVYVFPRGDPISPTVTQRAFPLAMKRVPSYTVSDSHTLPRMDDEEKDDGFPQPHSETASIISSIFAPPLRHLASHPSLHGSVSSGTPPTRGRQQQGPTPITEQRHPGKADARISRFTKPLELDTNEDDGKDDLRHVRHTDKARDEKHSTVSQSSDEEGEGEQWVQGWPLTFLAIGLCLVVFLISADRTILTTAIPHITTEFQSTADIGWYGSAHLLTTCAFQPVFGRVFMLFSVKWSYVLATSMFLVGSLVCGLAPDSITLIVGRAVAGFGSAGILTGSFVVVATAVPLRVRPMYTAIVGLMFGLGATVGPLLGGVFTDLVTWRWCFYMNLPIGGFALIVFLFFFHPQRHPRGKQTFFDRILDLDMVGNVLLLGACIMLFLALEYTAQGEAWSTARIIGLISGAGVTAVIFAAWQWWKQDGALIPPAIITQRTVAASCVAAFATYGALLIHAYFLPIWFQAIRGESAISSGVDMIPYVAAIALFSLLAGVFVSVVGYFAAPAIIGGVIATAGCGLLRLLSPDTPTAHWVGFEILVAAGFGMAIQQGFTAVQAVLPPDEVPIGTAAVVASQSLGGAIFISVGNALFQNHLLQASAENAVPAVDIRVVLGAGVAAFRTAVPAGALPMMLTLYNEALRVAFTAAIPLAGVSAIAACFLEWKSRGNVLRNSSVKKQQVSTGAAPGIGAGIGAPLALAIGALIVMLLREEKKTRVALSSQMVIGTGMGMGTSEWTAYVPVEIHGQPVPNELSNNHDRRHGLSGHGR
ncbi:major facilitator superfamily transporter [Colletotrichum orchidophilum]|uniref:Major facilitator superfamily transporter n=1 Tax=Colletotrichum orchidophilum TaxID=1209926 RepID=A0A1G4BI15_9PEZI|nr:major facilitator superfamily transporter [Colletotrichum orchidophilum]OHF01150.1 major facilitator superfamily transporter [Colletotrichum orchidophilum]